MLNTRVEISGVNTSSLPTLSAKEKRELLIKVKEGDGEAKEKYIKGNLRLVLSMVQKFSNRGENIDDLFQIGCVGLIKAIDNFDLSQNVEFSTYAVPMILGEIKRFLRDNSAIRVSRSLKDTAYKMMKEKEKYIAIHGKEPSIKEISTQSGIPEEDLICAMEAIIDPISLYETVYSDGNDAIYVMDQIKDKKSDDNIWTDNIVTKQLIDNLDEREKDVILKRFYGGKTQMEIAEELGISQAQISRIEKGALSNMRKKLIK